MKFTAEVLSAAEQQRVHAESLRILAEVGVKFLGKTALPLLKKAGARVDEDSHIARLPKELVDEALQTGPPQLHPGRPQPGLRLPIAVPGYALLHRRDSCLRFGLPHWREALRHPA